MFDLVPFLFICCFVYFIYFVVENTFMVLEGVAFTAWWILRLAIGGIGALFCIYLALVWAFAL